MKTKLALATGLIALHAATAHAAPQSFDFADPKKVNNVIFRLDAPLEAINGTSTGVSGKVDFDPANPGDVKGRIVVSASSLTVPNPLMQEHMLGANWLDTKQHPEIVFEAVKAANVKTDGNVSTADITGKLSLKGVTREVVVPAKFTYLKDKLRARGGGKDGDLLVIRSTFKIKRADFGIQAGKNEDKVSDEIELSLSVAGAAPR